MNRILSVLLTIISITASNAHAICEVEYTESGDTIAFLDKDYPTRSQRTYHMKGAKYEPIKDTVDFKQSGQASWYGRPFHGRKTASGEVYNMFDYTAAHPTLPIPSCVKITNVKNGKTVVVRVNDRGPFKSDLGTDTSNRIIDLSLKAAVALDFRNEGIADVLLEVLPTQLTQKAVVSRMIASNP
ncbi:MAG: rare lipoprotein A [Alphaproteobacteria bacterium]|jgi:rare lipoprotein A